MTISANTSPENHQTMKSASLIGLSALGGAMIGFVLQLLVAYYFGAGSSTDAYFMAQTTSEMMSKILLGGSVAAVFLPMFVERLTHNQKEEAWRLALNLFHLLGVALIILTFLIMAFAAPFVRFIAPGFSPETSALTVSLLRVMVPSFALLFLVDLSVAMLHALQHFLIPALLRIVAPTISLVSILVLTSSLGIYALAWGVVAGAIVQLILVLWALTRHGFRYEFVWEPHSAAIKRLFQLVYPFIAAMIVTQLAGIVYRILVSDLTPGSLSALKYAEKITQMCTIVFLSSITTVIFPILSQKAGHQDFHGMRETMGSAVRLVVFIMLPLITGIALLRIPFITILYERGSFTTEDTLLTSVALLFLVIGLVGNGISSVLGHATLALQKTRASVIVTIASQFLAIGLFVLLVPRMAHAGLALASSLVPIGITGMYFFYLRKYIPHLHMIFWQPTLIKTIFLTIILAVTMWFTQNLIGTTPPLLFQLLIPALIGLIPFILGAYFLRIEELRYVQEIGKNSLHKWQKKTV